MSFPILKNSIEVSERINATPEKIARSVKLPKVFEMMELKIPNERKSAPKIKRRVWKSEIKTKTAAKVR